jgi:tRNA(His) 5'-end guanylyltransferase
MELLKLSKKFKNIERKFEIRLDPDKHTIIRVDGHKFHKYTKQFSSPFDTRISYALFESAKEVVKRLSNVIRFFYIQSDEISFYIPPKDYFTMILDWQDVFIPYNLRTMKLSSLISSFVTAHFNSIINNTPQYVFEHMEQLYNKFKFRNGKFTTSQIKHYAMFDCRVFSLDSVKDVEEYFTWRRIDAIRNSKNQFSYAYLSHKQTLNLSSNERVKLVAKLYNQNYCDLPEYIKVGMPVSINKRINFGFKNVIDFNQSFKELL